ncbi:MAG: hypothetical protein M5R41_00260 [Bacteroidia bacterium]|nr:hypothetical protein [Bacteroidia bacterium]
MIDAANLRFRRTGVTRSAPDSGGWRNMLSTVVFLCVLCGSAVQAQDMPFVTGVQGSSGMDSLRSEALATSTPDATEKLLWLTGATLSYAMFDYVGFNLVRDNSSALPFFRVIQALVQAGITWILYEKLGLPTATAFNLVWWTWGTDAMFYGYTELFNVGGSWKGRGVFRSDILDNNCKWASWTPVGMLRGMDSSRPIAGDTLLAQFLVGAAAAVTITVTF